VPYAGTTVEYQLVTSNPSEDMIAPLGFVIFSSVIILQLSCMLNCKLKIALIKYVYSRILHILFLKDLIDYLKI